MLQVGRQVPKTIVIAGAHSNVGKTRLAGAICDLIEGAVHIKIGHGPRKEGLGNIYYPHGTPIEEILAAHSGNEYLVIESGRAATTIDPDCLIFLPGDKLKPGAEEVLAKADIVRGVRRGQVAPELLARRLGLSRETAGRIIELAHDTGRSER